MTAMGPEQTPPGLDYPINESTGMPRSPCPHSRSAMDRSSSPLIQESRAVAPLQDVSCECHVGGKQQRHMLERQALMARRRAERLRLTAKEAMSADIVPGEPVRPRRDKKPGRERVV